MRVVFKCDSIGQLASQRPSELSRQGWESRTPHSQVLSPRSAGAEAEGLEER